MGFYSSGATEPCWAHLHLTIGEEDKHTQGPDNVRVQIVNKWKDESD